MLDRLPGALLRVEGIAVAAGAVALYVHAGLSWWLFLALVLAPDLSMLAYLAGPRVGAAAYDVAHTTVLPIALAVVGVLGGADTAVAVGLVWLVHIGVDRGLGYGLKYPTRFEDTHLQRV
ncbi:MAG: DUF4260 domain-containing protein [Gaiella sp.]